MLRTPRLVINICDRIENGFIAFGLFDLTIPAAAAIMDRTFDTWSTGFIPPTTQVCTHLTHEARTASWNGTLYSFDLPHAAPQFEAKVDRFGGAVLFLEYLEAKYAARGIRRHAEAMYAKLEKAEFVPATRLEWLAHPLTGEVRQYGDTDLPGDVPFAFAGMEAVWRGVDARDLYDFTKERGGHPDALEFLAASFTNPDDIVRDVVGLDDAVVALRQSRDLRQFRKWVDEWNSKQDVRVALQDERLAVSLVPSLDKPGALEWCRRYVMSAIELEDSVDAMYSNP